jgi:Predicted solute binding protein
MPDNAQDTPEKDGRKPSTHVRTGSGQGPSYFPSQNLHQPPNAPQPSYTPQMPASSAADTPGTPGTLYNAATEFFNDKTLAGTLPIADQPTVIDQPTITDQPIQHGNPENAPQASTQQQSAPQPSSSANRKAAIRAAHYSKADPVPPGSPLNKIAILWHRDAAYKVLFVAISAILLCGIGGIILITSALGHDSQQANNANTTPMTQTPTPNTQQQLQATAQAATATAQAITPTAQPSPTPTPMPSPTPTQAPTPTPNDNGPLTVQLGNLPASVDNNTTVTVTTTANHPGTTVQLVVVYTGVQPQTYNSQSQTVDANGNTNFYWNIKEKVIHSYHGSVMASVTVTAQDQNGNTQTSTAQTVQINM